MGFLLCGSFNTNSDSVHKQHKIWHCKNNTILKVTVKEKYLLKVRGSQTFFIHDAFKCLSNFFTASLEQSLVSAILTKSLWSKSKQLKSSSCHGIPVLLHFPWKPVIFWGAVIPRTLAAQFENCGYKEKIEVVLCDYNYWNLYAYKQTLEENTKWSSYV